MSKQGLNQLNHSTIRKKAAKSTDLKRRLFEVGLNLSPTNNNSPLLNTIASPKRNMLTKHPLYFSKKQSQPHLLKFQPSNSPQMAKTSKDFQIRKSPKQIFTSSPSPKNQQNLTTSSFYRPDSIRGDSKNLKSKLIQFQEKQQEIDQCLEQKDIVQSKLDEYVALVLRGVQHIDQFLYLVRGSEQNIYELELVDFQMVQKHEGQNGFQYYTVSKKGFCQYIGGKPHAFLDISQWKQEKQLYMKIKSLKFFYRFRRWKTLQMWRRTITKQRRQAISQNLKEKLFLLEPTTRVTLLELRRLTLLMEKSVLIIAKNEGAYTLQSFKHCQQRARRQASLAVEEYSRESRAVVRKCFENKLIQLRQNMKKKVGDEKSSSPSHSNAAMQSPKQSAFQALGFPSKMSYQHRSKLRKQAGRFLRFSYLVDSIHLSCLAGLYAGQVSGFITRLQQYQLGQSVKQRPTIQQGKDQIDRQKMFMLQLICNFKDIPQRLICQFEDKQQWNPSRDIMLKNQQRGIKYWVPRLCQFWLNLEPNFDQVLDELGFLIRQGLSSLKCFEKWARHRQMQKYVSILQQWDDLVSENWQISENDNLDPLLLLDSLDPALTKLKMILKTTQNKLQETIRNILTELLNAYWQYSEIPLIKLESQDLINPAETFEQFLLYTSKLLQKVTNELPHRIELGVISIQVTRIKTTLGQKFAGILQNLKVKLPELVQDRTNILNNWLILFGGKLRQEILNIDDFVKIVQVIKQIQKQFGQKRQQCNQLAQLYQTMQQFRMDTRRRKDFQTITLKLKDQLQQLLITAQQNIQRKTDLYTKQVLKYHLPTLIKDINKTLENVQQPRFLKIDSYRVGILQDLQFLENRKNQLVQQRIKCQQYMNALKIQGQSIAQLNQLSKQIQSRLELWKTLENWQNLNKQYQNQIVKNLPISLLIQLIQEYRQTLQKLEESLPPNEILSFLKASVKEYHINLPILNGFSQSLSDQHWIEIYQTLSQKPQKHGLDLKKREFTLQQFLKSSIGQYAKQVQSIFEKCRVEAKLQKKYQQMEDGWNNLIAKIKVEGRFTVITNGQSLRQQLNQVLFDLTTLLSNPHAQSLKQYSITYQSLLAAQQSFEIWLRVQDNIVQAQKNCRLLDIKKLPDYNFFQNAQRLYKQITKPMSNKGAQAGVKIGKLILTGVQQKLLQIEANLKKIQQNIKGILRDHRRYFPSFYLFTDKVLLQIITQQTHQSIEYAAKTLIPSISRLQFQNQRISSIITIDQDRFIKNPISISSQIQQILFQITETMNQLNRRTIRSCRYKAIENNISGLVEQYNIQHLLAISRVDFSHYTTISIENQQQTPDSLSQFRKVMRKDTAQDIKNRQHRINQISFQNDDQKFKKTSFISKYDTLLLQQLLYQQILDYLIRSNIQRAEEYAWASNLKFFWQDTPTQQPNITVKQMHLSLKYGNEFIGSKTKVILQNQVEILLGLKYNDCVAYVGNKYNIERIMNAIGYKMLAITCNQLTTKHSLSKFIIGCYFADFIPFFSRADQLPTNLLQQLATQKWVADFKANSLKKSTSYVKDIDKIHTVYLNIRDTITGWQSLQGIMRVVHYIPPKKQYLKCNMKLKGIFSQQRTNLLLRIFEAVWFLQQKSKINGICLQQFLDQLIKNNQQIDQHTLFQKLLQYLKSKITLETYNSLTKHIQSLALLPYNNNINDNKNKLDNIFQYLNNRKIIILTGKGNSKKYFLKKYINNKNILFINIFTEILQKQQLYQYQSQNYKKYHIIYQKYLNNKQQTILYLERITSDILLSLQNLIYSDNTLSNKFHNSNIKIIIDLSYQQNILTPRQLTNFPILNYQTPKDYINQYINNWLQNNINNQQQHNNLYKILIQIIIPSIQNLSSKDQLILQQKIILYIKYLTSLLPFKNLLQACIYTLIIMYRGSQQQQIKLQYIVKKYIGQQKFIQDIKINQLFYKKYNQQQKLINQIQYLKLWIEENQYHDQNYIITPNLLHSYIICERIQTNTIYSTYLQGNTNTCKTTLFNIYRKLHHQNSFYMYISIGQGPNWNKKLTSTLHKHGLNIIGARINYEQTIIIIQDIHLSQKKQFLDLQLMLLYQKCIINNKQYLLRNIKFMLSGYTTPKTIQQKILKIIMNTHKQQLQTIFNQYLKSKLDKQWQLSQLFINKIYINTINICKKIFQYQQQKYKLLYTYLKRIINSFNKLKIKQGTIIQKQIQKYWSFLLLQSLTSYNKYHILQQQFKKLQLTYYNTSILSYTHLSSKPTQKRIQFLKDPKRLYNLLNQKIQKYNQNDIKRYGQSFQFINFDNILSKIITISHSILLDTDHLIIGRKGTGKQSLVKLCAFLNGLFYKNIKSSIKTSITQLLQNNISSPHLLYKNLTNQQDIKLIQQYYYCDFQSQILCNIDNKNNNKNNKQKQKTINIKSGHKNNIQNYIIPKTKLNYQQVLNYKKLFRLILSLNTSTLLSNIKYQILSKIHIDYIQQVPTSSIIQYNQKLLNIDGITCTKQSQLVLSQIFQYCRQKLGLSLRSNDDCVRLFSSFLANLINQMILQQQRYRKVLQLNKKLKNCYNIINQQINKLHHKLKDISQNLQNNKDIKLQIQIQLRQKSTAQSICQKLIEILNWLQPLYNNRLSGIQQNLNNRQNLQIIFAITASYFIYLSNISYTKRRQYFYSWYQNIKIISHMKPISSFLSLFLLYQNQFNAEPVDHLPQFYQNMSIIFHSAKPIAIKDENQRGRNWLQKNCSFLYLRQDQKDFIQLIKQYLNKSNNILIQIIQQQNLNKITQSLIGTLLFLPQSINSINIKGQQIQIHQQAKVYLLLKQQLIIPKQIEQQFTIVLFDQSQQLCKTSILHQYYNYNQRQYHISRLDYHRKIRNLKMDCQNIIGQISDNIYQQLCGNQFPPTENILIQKLNKITDKLMVRAQNQFTKIKQKQQLIYDLQQKYQKINQKINIQPAQQFYIIYQQIKNILYIMSNTYHITQYQYPKYAQYFNIIKILLSKGIITTKASLILSTLRQWGPAYKSQHYRIFAFLLLMAARGKQISQFMKYLTEDGIKDNKFLTLIGRQNEILLNESDIDTYLSQDMITLFKNEDYISIGPIIFSHSNLYMPLIWQIQQSQPQNEILKIIKIKSNLQITQIKQKLLINNPKLIQPSQDQNLQILLKKISYQDIQLFIHNKQIFIETQKILKQLQILQKTIIFLYNPNNINNINYSHNHIIWQISIQNQQNIFCNIIQQYKFQKQKQNQIKIQNIQINNNHTSNTITHTFYHDHTSQIYNDQLSQLITKFINCIYMKYKNLSLNIIQISIKQQQAIRKSIENNQNPLTLLEKINILLSTTISILHISNHQIIIYAKQLQTKIIKLCSQAFSEEDFFKDCSTALAEASINITNNQLEEYQLLNIQLGWLASTRRFFGVDNKPILEKYQKQIDNCINSCLIYNQAPKVTRGSKRQLNIKSRRQSSINKKGRDSQNIGKRMFNKPITPKILNSPLASLYLLKQSQYFEHILYKIHMDLQKCKQQIQNIHNNKLSNKTLKIILNIIKNQPISTWKQLFSSIGCTNTSLNISIRNIITRRNQIYTYYNKFSISQSCQLQFKYIRHPAEFLRAYFRSQLTNQDTFMLTTSITPEEAQRGQYLRINGMWGIGWRLTPEGIIQNTGDNKPTQINGCYIVKKTTIGMTVNSIELFTNPQNPEFLLKIYGMSKKMQTNISLKLFLKYD